MPRPSKQFAVYKGDKLLATGSVIECASQLGVHIHTIYNYASPHRHKRASQNKWKEPNYTLAYRIED